MGDLIDRETTKKTLTRLMADHMRNRARMHEIAVSVLDAIDDMPAVDAEPVVYCRDCVLWKPVDKNTGKCPFLIGEHQYTGAEHYCSCGARMKEAMNE